MHHQYRLILLYMLTFPGPLVSLKLLRSKSASLLASECAFCFWSDGDIDCSRPIRSDKENWERGLGAILTRQWAHFRRVEIMLSPGYRVFDVICSQSVQAAGRSCPSYALLAILVLEDNCL